MDWKEAKKELLQIWEDNSMTYCEYCMYYKNKISTYMLSFHHIDGRRIDNPHSPKNIIQLCINCHNAVEHTVETKQYDKKIREYVKKRRLS